MNATAISEEAIPALIEGLRDPEVQVRANCAHALARLDAIPAAAIPLLIECTADANDGLRMSAATALKLAPAEAVIDVMQHLVADPNSRVRLIAASSLLVAEPGNILAGAVLTESLQDPVLRVREAALELLEAVDPKELVGNPLRAYRVSRSRVAAKTPLDDREPIATTRAPWHKFSLRSSSQSWSETSEGSASTIARGSGCTRGANCNTKRTPASVDGEDSTHESTIAPATNDSDSVAIFSSRFSRLSSITVCQLRHEAFPLGQSDTPW